MYQGCSVNHSSVAIILSGLYVKVYLLANLVESGNSLFVFYDFHSSLHPNFFNYLIIGSLYFSFCFVYFTSSY